jgi:archaemetzincin
MLGVTMEDIYPGPDWNFVFGQATLRDRAGIYSFARYDPAFYGSPRPEGWRQLVLLRSCKVLAHETGHMFGIRHCTAYHCVMNGTNSLPETDAHPLHLCPIDLHKLQHSVGFDPLEHYQGLLTFSEEAGFTDEAAWLRKRIAYLRQ